MRYRDLQKEALICGLALVLLLTPLTRAQKTQDADDVVKVKSNLVNIDVIVKDKKGKYISDLKPEDFAITEDGVAQKIEFFDAPLSKIETRKPGETGTETPQPAPVNVTRNFVALVLDSQTTDI